MLTIDICQSWQDKEKFINSEKNVMKTSFPIRNALNWKEYIFGEFSSIVQFPLLHSKTILVYFFLMDVLLKVSFRFTTLMSRSSSNFLHTLWLHTCTAFPSFGIPHHSVCLLEPPNLQQRIIITLSPHLTLGFTLSVAQSIGLKKLYNDMSPLLQSHIVQFHSR